MNGRLYSPEIGRFLSADPFTQFPESTQGFNRYSYVGNNPMSYTDPSGHYLDDFASEIVGLVGVALNFVPFCQFWCQVGWSAVTGGVSGYLATGSFKGAIRGAATSAALTTVGHNFGAGGKGVSAASDTWNFHRVLDVITQTVGVFNPKAAAKLALLNGTIYHGKKGPLSAGKFLADSYVKGEIVRPALRRYANSRGLTLTELNIGLAALSFAGNELVGSRFIQEEQTITGFYTRRGTSLIPDKGVANTIGIVFDVVDTALAYQGLPTASSIDAMLGYTGGTLTGHSLGAIDANNLYNQGFVQQVSLQALPFLNIAASKNVSIQLGDPISGMFFGIFTNPNATVVDERDANGDLCIHVQKCGF